MALRKPIDWEAQPLGREPDLDTALRLGVSLSTVHRHRTRLGISAFRDTPAGRYEWSVKNRVTSAIASRIVTMWRELGGLRGAA